MLSVLLWEWARHPPRQGGALAEDRREWSRVGPQLRVGLRKRPARWSCPPPGAGQDVWGPLPSCGASGSCWEEVGSQDCLPWEPVPT